MRSPCRSSELTRSTLWPHGGSAMRTLLAVVLLAASANAAAAADHVVTPDVRDARLRRGRELRAEHLRTVDRLLEAPGPQEAVAGIGADLGSVRAALGTSARALDLREELQRSLVSPEPPVEPRQLEP